ncbi:hypothetical protein NC653_002292 [Populus alba x Populus x berolinensis]|uniref:Uncharacterized protein n=1 Tax=Populus alba x Populus x berolinensis TaxID=444605 RepID=A0AAD6RNC9_9ROSI|nr:hypothetical protein NC653_002292 [Populus alba x Populus x berolinensis]
MLQQQSLILTVISKTRKGCPLCSQENDNWTGPQCNTDYYSSTWHGIARHSVRRWPCYWNLSGKNGVGCYINRYRCIPLPHRADCPKLQEQINIRGHNKMRKLDLSRTKLYGSIPRPLLSLEFNDLNGSIPKTHTLQSFGPDSCSSNPQLCGPPTLNTCNNVSTAVDGEADHNNTNSPPDEPPRTSSKPNSATTFILLDVVGLAAVILLFIFLL